MFSYMTAVLLARCCGREKKQQADGDESSFFLVSGFVINRFPPFNNRKFLRLLVSVRDHFNTKRYTNTILFFLHLI